MAEVKPTSGRGLQAPQVVEHLPGVPGDIGDVVHALDDAVGVDEEGHPLRVVGIWVAIGANHVVRRGDLSVDIGQEPEPEALRVGEGLVVLRCVV